MLHLVQVMSSQLNLPNSEVKQIQHCQLYCLLTQSPSVMSLRNVRSGLESVIFAAAAKYKRRA